MKNIIVNFNEVEAVVFDFDGVFTDNHVFIDQHGNESIRCYRSDGIGIERIQSLGIKTMIISSEIDNVVQKRAKKLSINCLNNIKAKDIAIKEFSYNASVPLNKILYLGNDINDIPALKIVGMPVGVADSFPELDDYILFKTNKRGGYGAVREICDKIYYAVKYPKGVK